MNWLANLYETYGSVWNNNEIKEAIEPFYHTTRQCHIEITIDNNCNLIMAQSLVREVKYGGNKYYKGIDTVIPITPKSLTSRTSGPAPYPLCDQIQYIAGDYATFGGKKKSYFKEYWSLLNSWASSPFSHPKVRAIANYVKRGSVVDDLVSAGVLFVTEDNGMRLLITNWAAQGHIDAETKKLKAKPLLLSATSNDQGNAMIRWRVQIPNEPDDLTWEDFRLIEAWQAFQAETNKANGFCQLLGRNEYITNNHPKNINPSANDAKLISAPSDPTYLTFLGRFTEQMQACAISFEVSQKAHNALRWLINRQGFRNGDQAFVAWAVSGKTIPDPLQNTFALFEQQLELQHLLEEEIEDKVDHAIDLGQSFAIKFNSYLSGYSAKLDPNEQIVIIGLDSATPGRMGIIYYRTLLDSEFIVRVQSWHLQFAWPQRYSIETNTAGKKTLIWPVTSPAPRLIAEAAYGDVLKSNEKLKNNLLERIMPSIIDGQPFPRDIMHSAVRRASNRNGIEHWAWEQNLGVACALYRGFYQRQSEQMRRNYSMSLEETRNTRDYLYGRLLAIAEKVEEVALSLGGEVRPTTAARMMQRFADRPFSTWRNIFLALQPYMQRLQSSRGGFLTNRKKDLDTVLSLFQAGEFEHDKPLSGEFLLGYHCQRMSYRQNNSDDANACEKGE